MAQATETFAVGAEQVTVVIEIDLSTVWLISGDFSGTIPSGEIGFINGNVNLTGDLIVEGLLTGIDTFTLTGNGFQILAQNGGVTNLQGVEKSAWVRWGDPAVGWQTGDSLVVAPTVPNVFFPAGTIWQGSWATTARPANSPDVLLPDGSVARPEVLNRSQTILLKNLRRIHFHDGAGIQNLKWLKVLDSGQTGVLAQYPIHFHLNGEASRGSLLEGVVVQNGKNHAFVPHASHGITFRDCVAYNTTNDAFWWDVPEIIPGHTRDEHTANNSNDTTFEHVLAMTTHDINSVDSLAAFLAGAGFGNSVVDSSMCCVQGGSNAAGFQWPSKANQNIGGSVWLFERNVSHNNKRNGSYVWQNENNRFHLLDDFTVFNNGEVNIEHGAYGTNYQYKNIVLKGSIDGFMLHAKDSGLFLENVVSDTRLRITMHQSEWVDFTIIRNSWFPTVVYTETQQGGDRWSWIRFENDGPIPTAHGGWKSAQFNLSGIVPQSIIEITIGGVVQHRWAAGVWS